MIFAIIYSITLHICCGYAVFYGQKFERIAGVVMYGASMLTWATLEFSSIEHSSLEIGVLVIDILMLAFLISIALLSRKTWTLFAAGFHLVGVIIHVAVFTKSDFAPIAYAHALTFWTYMVLISLAVGTYLIQKSQKV